MNLGIVGHGKDKFVPRTENAARWAIRQLIVELQPSLIISGRSPVGGIDIWAIEVAKGNGVAWREYPPVQNASWSCPGGYRDRNLQIARNSDLVVCIVVKNYPPNFRGMRFLKCYHCEGTAVEPHVKSGGCWTAWQARQRRWIVLA